MDILIIINALIVSALFNIGIVFSYHVELNLSHNGPVVLGANITFTAELTNSLNQPPNGNFVYEWHDNARVQHRDHIMETKNTTVRWNVSYPAKSYAAQEYELTVKAFINEYLYFQLARQDIKFNVTETLNGKIEIEQEDLKNGGAFVSNASPVRHTIKLSEPDYNYLTSQATSVLTYWFVDCNYYGFTTDYSFSFNYTEEKSYNVEALVVASFDEPPPTTTTTTTTSTTTASTTQATPIATSSTVASSTATTSNAKSAFLSTTLKTSNDPAVASTQIPLSVDLAISSKLPTSTKETSTAASTSESLLTNQVVVDPVLQRMISEAKKLPEAASLKKRQAEERGVVELNITRNSVLSYACLNSTFVPPDPNKTYGYFRTQISAKVPITKVNVKGNNWLQFGDVLNLNITCNGSGKFQHCRKITVGVYNVTGDEKCEAPLEDDACDFSLTHYFREKNTYTYIIIIMNDVSKVVTPAVIRMYKVTVQPQLSVIVVPVTCSLLAIIIIVFGVAYYVQSQNRYTIEVADFDFGQVNDMEYKSFYERLREDISNMFSRTGDFLDQTDVLPQRSKYDNMEES